MREARDTRYHRLFVVEDETSRYLRFDSSFQSGMYLDDPFRTRFLYSDYLHLGLAYKPDAKKILVVGLGGASAPKRMWRDFDDLQITTVELDPEVVRPPTVVRAAARPAPRRRGRRRPALPRSATTERYDVIMVDAFYSDGVPFHLTTLEFVELMRERLTPGGVVATNVIGAITGGSSQITRALVETYGAVFPTVELHPGLRGRGRPPPRRHPEHHPRRDRARRADAERGWPRAWNGRSRRRVRPARPTSTKAIRDRWERDVRTGDVPLLTDGYAPTDALLLG